MITENEAAESLRDVERVSRRTHVASAYALASPHLILWGLVWIAILGRFWGGRWGGGRGPHGPYAHRPGPPAHYR